MIQLQNVTKRIKENTVLDNVSYTFKSGFVYGLYGQNGSGKNMLLRAISGLINLDSGSIFIDGEKLHDKIEFPPDVYKRQKSYSPPLILYYNLIHYISLTKKSKVLLAILNNCVIILLSLIHI